jgi:hypothetical protein
VSEEVFERVDIALRQIRKLLGSLQISALKRALRFCQVVFHTRLAGSDVTAKAVAGRALLLLQMVQTAVDRNRAIGKLIDIALGRI